MTNVIRLGNDIVDFSFPETKGKYLNKRFLNRVFTPEESEAIENALHQDKVFWAIWAAKEAAYKACKKEYPELVFAHKKFSLSRDTLNNLPQLVGTSQFTGQLFYQNHTFDVQWEWDHKDCVHCIVIMAPDVERFDDWTTVSRQVSKITRKKTISSSSEGHYFSSSEYTLLSRLHAKQFLQELGFCKTIEIKRPEITIQNRYRKAPPMLYLAGKALDNHEISLSHDGSWVAVALQST